MKKEKNNIKNSYESMLIDIFKENIEKKIFREDILEYFYNKYSHGMSGYYKNINFMNTGEKTSDIFDILIKSMIKYQKNKSSFITFLYNNTKYRVMKLMGENISEETKEKKLKKIEEEISLIKNNNEKIKKLKLKYNAYKHYYGKNRIEIYSIDDFEELGSEENLENEIMNKLIIDKIKEELKKEKEEERKIFEDRILYGKKTKDIAKIYNMSIQNVGYIIKKIKDRIKKRIEL